MKSLTVFFSAGIILLALTAVFLSSAARADDNLPAQVSAQLHMPLAQVGAGTYRRFGFSVYRASLWAPNGVWDASKTYALKIEYTRSVSKETLVDTVTDDIRDQKVADDATMTRWGQVLDATLTAVQDGDTLIGIFQPGKSSLLFFNGKKIASIDDQALAHAFFNIWLGDTADEDLRAKLLGKDK